MLTPEQARQLVDNGGRVLDTAREKIGSIGQIFIDDRSGEPEWVTVKSGLLGGPESFVPIRDAEVLGDDLRVPYSRDTVKDAPRISHQGRLKAEEESALREHYGSAPVEPADGTPRD